jgi:hypothetical protein
MLDYAAHWSSQGATAKRVILGAFEAVIENAEGEDEGESEGEGENESESENEETEPETTSGSGD